MATAIADERMQDDVQGREITWIEQAIRENPNQVFQLNPDDPNELVIRVERNKRPVPPVGDKSLSDLISSMENLAGDNDTGQLQPCLATLNENGIPDLYIGFRRARAIQTRNKGVQEGQRVRLNVIITDRILTEDQVGIRTIAENAYRVDPTPMQKSEIITGLLDQGLTLKDVSSKVNMAVSAVSVYARFSMFPANAKKALQTGKMQYSGAESLVAMLPKREELAADEGGELLKKAQDKIAAMTDKLLSGGGVVTRLP